MMLYHPACSKEMSILLYHRNEERTDRHKNKTTRVRQAVYILMECHQLLLQPGTSVSVLSTAQWLLRCDYTGQQFVNSSTCTSGRLSYFDADGRMALPLCHSHGSVVLVFDMAVPMSTICVHSGLYQLFTHSLRAPSAPYCFGLSRNAWYPSELRLFPLKRSDPALRQYAHLFQWFLLAAADLY